MMTDEDTGVVDSDWDSLLEELSSRLNGKTRSSKSVGKSP